MIGPGTSTEDLPIPEDLAHWLARAAYWAPGGLLLMVPVVVFLIGVSSLLGLAQWLITGRGIDAAITTLIGGVIAVVAAVVLWRFLRAQSAQVPTELREGVFLRTTSFVAIECVRGGSNAGGIIRTPSAWDDYKLEVTGYGLRLNPGDGYKLVGIMRRQPDVFVSELTGRTSVTMGRGIVDHTKYSHLFLALYDSAGQLLYRAWS